MKTLILASCLLLLTFSCKDDDNESPPVANDEAADMVATSLASGAGGMSMVVEETSVSASSNAGGRIQACGYTGAEDVTKTSPGGAAITYNYSFHYDYALTCSGALPSAYTANVNYTGSLSTARVETENEGNATLTVKTLDATYNYFIFNGSYDRSGSFESKVRAQNTSSSTITFNLMDVTVDKATKTITGGTASLAITGTVTGKGTFSYSGTVTFKGNKQAELNINGTGYAVNLETGDVTAL